MTTLFDAVPQLALYQTSFLVLAILTLKALLQSFVTAPTAFVSAEQIPGMPLRFDHGRLSFRALRAYANTVENLPAFGFAVLIAAAAGATPWAVNGLAVTYLVSRVLFCALYYAGVGKPAGGPRTFAYIAGAFANIGLSILAIHAVLMLS